MYFDEWYQAHKERLGQMKLDEALLASYRAGARAVDDLLPSLIFITSRAGFELKQTDGGFICGIYPNFVKAPSATGAIAAFAAIHLEEKNVEE